MNKRTAVIIGLVVMLILGIVVFRGFLRATSQEATMTATLDRVRQVNLSRPERQTQAKMLIMAMFVQKRIPDASHWCDTLNAGGKIWPVTPTNTSFALNANVAGRALSSGISGQTVVFFESAHAGWNQSGGTELLATESDGVAVACADGRALILTPTEVANLRWTP